MNTNFKCIFGYEEKDNFICSYDKQPCECSLGTPCRIVEQFKEDYIEQINWDYRAHENPYD